MFLETCSTLNVFRHWSRSFNCTGRNSLNSGFGIYKVDLKIITDKVFSFMFWVAIFSANQKEKGLHKGPVLSAANICRL